PQPHGAIRIEDLDHFVVGDTRRALDENQRPPDLGEGPVFLRDQFGTQQIPVHSSVLTGHRTHHRYAGREPPGWRLPPPAESLSCAPSDRHWADSAVVPATCHGRALSGSGGNSR